MIQWKNNIQLSSQLPSSTKIKHLTSFMHQGRWHSLIVIDFAACDSQFSRFWSPHISWQHSSPLSWLLYLLTTIYYVLLYIVPVPSINLLLNKKSWDKLLAQYLVQHKVEPCQNYPCSKASCACECMVVNHNSQNMISM